MTTDNRTNEPTPEQVEAAAKALRADEGFIAEVHSALEVSWSEYIARLVLVAAQGAASQAEPDPYRIVRVLHEHQRDTSVASRVKCVCGVASEDRASHRLHQAELIAHLEASPVLPSSGVDEEKLAEVILAAEYAHRDAEFRGVRGIGTLALYQARAVTEWLKGQGNAARE